MTDPSPTDPLVRDILEAARARSWRIATAESCTGGLVGGAITAVPGSSDVFECGFVTYSYRSKVTLLGVTQTILADEGAVSEAAARAMADGARARADADLTVAITGIAGPGGSDMKPEGLVWFAVSSPDGTEAENREFGALGRAEVRRRSVETALQLVLQALRRTP